MVTSIQESLSVILNKFATMDYHMPYRIYLQTTITVNAVKHIRTSTFTNTHKPVFKYIKGYCDMQKKTMQTNFGSTAKKHIRTKSLL